MRILIAGCGDVGTRLGLQLVADGHRVWGLRRRPELLPSNLIGLAADLTDPASLVALPRDLDQVVYIAAADQSTEKAYQRAYVDGLRNLLAATTSGRLLFVSSTSVYGQDDGGWVDEESATNPASFRGHKILEAERLLSEADRYTVVVRFAGIYGPGRTRLIESVRNGEAVCWDDPPLYTNRIHVDDCAGMLRHLGQLSEPESIYLGVDHEPAPDGEVKRWLARRLRVSEPSTAADRDTSRRRMSANKRCSNRRLLATGYEFRYPDYRAGYEAVLRQRSVTRL